MVPELERSLLVESELRSVSAWISRLRAREESTWRNSSSRRAMVTCTAPDPPTEDEERGRGLPTAAGDGEAEQVVDGRGRDGRPPARRSEEHNV